MLKKQQLMGHNSSQ